MTPDFDDEFLSVAETATPSPPATDSTSANPPKRKRKRSIRNPSGLTDYEEQRLISRSIREGWNKQERFPVSDTVESIKAIPKKQLTPAQLAMRTAIAGCESGKTIRDKTRAAKNIIDMVKVNQVDDIKEVPPTPIGVAVNVSNNSDGSATASVEASGPKVVLYLPENGR